jgi:signal transduction histidine kinase
MAPAVHAYVLIPLASFIAASAFAGAVAAREPDRRSNRLVAAILLSAAAWALFELLCAAAPDARSAAGWLRWSYLGALAIGPLACHLVLTVASAPRPLLRRVLPPAWTLAGAGAALSVASEQVVAGATASPWGWTARAGPALAPVYALVVAMPAFALFDVFGVERSDAREKRMRLGLGLVGSLLLGFGAATDVALPLLGIPFPRLGCAGLVAWGGLTWASYYRFREPLLAPQAFAREILDILPDGVALVRLDGRIRSCNERLAELAEVGPGELQGLALEALIPDAAALEGACDGECELVTGSGHRILVSAARSPLRDEEGGDVGHVLVVRDVREVVSLRSRLIASGRIAAVGQLAAGIAHEINNPIAYARSNLSLLERHWEELGAALDKDANEPGLRQALEEGPEILSETSEGIDRVAAIVREIGGFSGSGAAARATADVAELLETAVRVAGPQLKTVRVERDFAERPRVPCVPRELMQVFLNLLLNASQALGEDGGSIRVSTRIEGDCAQVEVADDGPGMEPATAERIFEPFFTTKDVGKGTGLGLSISQQIVEAHGGSVAVETAPGAGTRFRIRLPLRSGRIGSLPPEDL